jgi:hypothetical protein
MFFLFRRLEPTETFYCYRAHSTLRRDVVNIQFCTR